MKRTPLRPMSSKRRRVNAERRRNMLAAFGSEPQCRVRWDDRCTGRADSVHELKKRSALGSITDPANCVPCCNPCNSAIEDHPLEARRRGWVVPSWADSEGEAFEGGDAA